jgi:iron complex outermembrane receptor protein
MSFILIEGVMMRVLTNRFLATSFLALSTASFTPAFAQSTPSADDHSQQNDGKLVEIVVTAQKTSTRLQKTPIAITTISPEQLSKADIRSVADLDKQVPGLAIMSGGAYPLNVTLRGVGYDGLQNNSAQPGVAFVENGVYIASPLNLSSSFLDVAQIEVLRGPQGTVNGQNADGGAINVTTGMPILGSFRFDGEAGFGSYDYNRLRAVVNAPFGETFALRAAFQHEGHDGWLNAPFQPNTKHTGDDDTWIGRLSALWKPTDRLSITVWGEYFDKYTNGLGVRNAIDPIGDVRSTSNDYPTPARTKSRIAAATLSYDLDFAVLKSISSYQHTVVNATNTGDLIDRASALAIYGVKDEEAIYRREAKSYTEEINLAHNGGKLDWIVGAFFLRTYGHEQIFETQQSSPVRIPYTPTFTPSFAELGALFGAGLAFESVSESRRTSVAGYGQATFHFSDSLRLTGGIRGSWDKYTSGVANFFEAPVPLGSKFSKITGKAVAEYDIVPNSTVYASFSTGVKPGGANLNPTAIIVPTSFRHEFVRAYEAGSKNEFFNRTLRLNLSAFYNDYRNLQSESSDPDPFGDGLVNIPKSHIYGLESEMSWVLPAGFRIDGNATVMRSAVDSHFNILDPQTAFAINTANGGRYMNNDVADRAAAFADINGKQLARVPHFSASGSITKRTDFGKAGMLELFVQANYRSGFWARIFNNPTVDRVGNQFTMNFNARYEPAHGPWYAELQVTNLTKSNDIASRFPDNFELGGLYDALVPPRQFIGRVGVRF